jgi:hypothetical protein
LPRPLNGLIKKGVEDGFDIAKGGNAPIASEALQRIAALYAIEKTIRGRSAAERHAVRQERSRPLVLALKAWLEHLWPEKTKIWQALTGRCIQILLYDFREGRRRLAIS